MQTWLEMIITIACAILASSGFWAYIQKRHDKNDVKAQMLIGLGHDRIIYLGMHYLSRVDENGEAYITQDEYENLKEYLYKPYKELGGNGSAERVMAEVDKLPIRKAQYHYKDVKKK
jgi:hypothetical protein